MVDVPPSILHRYVFIPTQKFDDLSVLRYSSISYPQVTILTGVTPHYSLLRTEPPLTASLRLLRTTVL